MTREQKTAMEQRLSEHRSRLRGASRKLTSDLLGEWALKDPVALAALRAGLTEEQLILALLEDRQQLISELYGCLQRTVPLAWPYAADGPDDVSR
jgi:hypothetical protein